MKTIEISDLEKGQDISIYLINGEVIRGIFQFIDNSEDEYFMVLKAIDSSCIWGLSFNIKLIFKIIISDSHENN